MRKRRIYFRAGLDMNSFSSSLSVRNNVGLTQGACTYKNGEKYIKFMYNTFLLVSLYTYGDILKGIFHYAHAYDIIFQRITNGISFNALSEYAEQF